VFIVLSVAWGALVDRVAPDRFDLTGMVICLVGVAVIMYGPR
jgi:small multidrug resistance family-3 protein